MKKLLLIFLTLHLLLLLNAQIEEIRHTDCSGTITEKCTSDCYYREIIHIIKPSSGKQVILTFKEFDVDPANGYVVVVDGDNVNGPEIGVYENSNPPPSQIISSGNGLLVYLGYSYDSQHENDGWVAEYTDNAMTAMKDKLLAYYPFNETAGDFSGSLKNGSVSNATLTTDKFGNTYNAYSFNGSNSLIYLPKPMLTDNTKFAISCWVKVNGNNFAPIVDYGQTIIDLRGQYQIALSYMETDHPTNPNSFMFYTYSSPNVKVIYSQNNSVQFGTWYHLLANYGNNTMEFYVNGALIGTSSQNPPGSVCCYNNTIGKDYNLNMNRCWFYGSIDEVIFFKQSLTTSEVQALYNSGLSVADIPELYGPLTFSYDAFGNRTGKNIISLKSGSFIATVRDSVSADAMNGEITQPEIYSESTGEYYVKIYPNPTRGELKVEITGFDFAQKSAIYMYNTAGHLVTQKSPASASNIIDLLRQPNGMYIMKILLGDKVSEWKIIKE